MVGDLVRLHDLDPEIYRPQKHTYYFPDLNMILWRDTVSTGEEDQGYIFDCVSLHTDDYYSPEAIASYRERMGFPPLKG